MIGPVQKIENVPAGLDEALTKLGVTRAYALLQGYPFTSFAVVTHGRVDVPPDFQADMPCWDLMRDIRLFAPRNDEPDPVCNGPVPIETHGEWHAWRDGRGNWKARLWRARDWAEPAECQPLWGFGNEVGESRDGWAFRKEGNGAPVWLPDKLAIHKYLWLRLTYHVEQDQESCLAYIADAMICGFSKGNA